MILLRLNIKTVYTVTVTMAATPAIYDLRVILEHSRATVVEWYILPEATQNAAEALWVPIAYDRPQFPSIRFRNPEVLEEYRYKELIYSYFRSNDAQRTISRLALDERWDTSGKVYRLLFQEDILPSHRFPCSSDVHINERLTRRSFKINNRLYLMEDQVERESTDSHKNKPMHHYHYHYYIRYLHAQNVDLDKIQQDLNQFITRYKF